MSREQYLVGYLNAMERMDYHITQSVKRNPINAFVVLNDVITNIHKELADVKQAIREGNEPTVLPDERSITEEEVFIMAQNGLQEILSVMALVAKQGGTR